MILRFVRDLRRFVSIAAIFALFGPVTAQAQTFQTLAPQAALMDAETGAIVFEVGIDQLVAPASLVKIMTAEVVFNEIKSGRLGLDQEFVVSENAWRKGGAPSGGSSMFLTVNSRVKISDLIAGLIVASGNDAAITLAEGLAGTEASFARMMNKRAGEIGLTRSTFRNASGFPDPEQKTTMRDLLKLSDHVIRTYPELYKVFGQREFVWNKIRQQNRNPLVFMDIGADGLKTGNIDESGFGIVGSAVQNGQRLILAMSGLKTARDRQNEARKLMDWGFRSFEVKSLFDANSIVGDISVFGGTQRSVPVAPLTNIRLPVPRGNQERITAKIAYRGPVMAPVEAGARIARLQVFRGTLMVLEVPLATTEAVAIGSMTQRAIDAALEAARALFKAAFQRATEKRDQPA